MKRKRQKMLKHSPLMKDEHIHICSLLVDRVVLRAVRTALILLRPRLLVFKHRNLIGSIDVLKTSSRLLWKVGKLCCCVSKNSMKCALWVIIIIASIDPFIIKTSTSVLNNRTLNSFGLILKSFILIILSLNVFPESKLFSSTTTIQLVFGIWFSFLKM